MARLKPTSSSTKSPDTTTTDAQAVANLKARLLKNVFKTKNGCWLWKLRPATSGHGRLKVNGKMVYAHRVAYELFVGPIPADLVVCHSCDTPLCVNPSHLFLGTIRDNTVDLARKGLTGAQVRPEAYEGKRRFGDPVSDQTIHAILLDFDTSKASQRTLATRHGVSKSFVNKLLRQMRDAGEVENPNVGRGT